jgi:hypothetical protein
MRRLEKQGEFTYTEFTNRNKLELECLRLKRICEKTTNFPREQFNT